MGTPHHEILCMSTEQTGEDALLRPTAQRKNRTVSRFAASGKGKIEIAKPLASRL